MNDLRLLTALLSVLTLAACSDSEPPAQSATNSPQQTQPASEDPLQQDLERTAQAASELTEDAEDTLEGAIAVAGDAIEEVMEQSQSLAAEATDTTGEGLEQAGNRLENLADRMGDPNAVVGTLAGTADAIGEELERVGDLLERGARQIEPQTDLESTDQTAVETTDTHQSPEEIQGVMELGQTLAQQGMGERQQPAQQLNRAMEQTAAMAPTNQPQQGSDQQQQQQNAQLISGPGSEVDPRTQEAISDIVQEAGQTIEQLLSGEITPAEARARLGQADTDGNAQTEQRMSPYPATASTEEVEQTAREAIDRIMTTAQQAIDRIVQQTARAAAQGPDRDQGLVEQAQETVEEAARTTEQTAAEAAQATGEALEEAVQTAEQTAGDTVEATEEALGEAAQATETVVEDAVEATEEAFQEAEQVVEEVVEDTGQVIEEAAQETGEALGIEGEQPDAQESVAEEAGEAIGIDQQQAGQPPTEQDDTARQDESAALPGVAQPRPAAVQDEASTEPLSTQGTAVSGEERLEELRDSSIPEEMVETIEENLQEAESRQPDNRPEQAIPEYQMTDQDDAVPQVGEQGGILDKPMGNTMDPNLRNQTTGTLVGGDQGDDQPRVGPDGGGMLDTDEGPGPYTENQPGGKFDDPSAQGRDQINYPQGQPEAEVMVRGEDEPRPAGATIRGEAMDPGGSTANGSRTGPAESGEGQQTGEADAYKVPTLRAEPQPDQAAEGQQDGQQMDNQRGPIGEADAYKMPVEKAGASQQPDDASIEAEEIEGRVEAMLESATRPAGEPKPFDAARREGQAEGN
ncbi:MAG: hypothetical protein R3310_05240 [Candidatus Competibacteraceae bacterium]|nr:hypothetical protein [Candidatus Competibacteraceae bacterium]